MPGTKIISESLPTGYTWDQGVFLAPSQAAGKFALASLPACTEPEGQPEVRVQGLLGSLLSVHTALSMCVAFWDPGNTLELFRALVSQHFLSTFWFVSHFLLPLLVGPASSN